MEKPKIYVYNSLTAQKELFQPIEAGLVKIYACGVTPYDDCHIGHAMQAIYFDVIRNYFEYIGYRVLYVRNFTDVDDKIIDRAKNKGISPRKLADTMMLSEKEDMAALGIRPANFQPKVSETIPEIIAMTQALIDSGYAYVTPKGDVYFRVAMKKDYGKLSNRKPDELLTGTRELAGTEKQDSLDFALWKRDAVPDASWESPWGLGRPGWHIECSAMAKKLLGDSFDIHGGGRDLIFPHHENEIAQSECANNADFARYWLHSGLLTIKHQKMSKSIGNTITIKAFLKSWHPEVLRIGFLQNQYSSNVNFAEDIFLNCRKRLFYFYKTLDQIDALDSKIEGSLKANDEKELHRLHEEFGAAMADDFNTPQAIAALNKMARWANQKLTDPSAVYLLRKLAEQIRKNSKILGVLQENPASFIDSHKTKILNELGLSEASLLELIQKRQEARQRKAWQESDQLRAQLTEKGISLNDHANGTSWTLIL